MTASPGADDAHHPVGHADAEVDLEIADGEFFSMLGPSGSVTAGVTR